MNSKTSHTWKSDSNFYGLLSYLPELQLGKKKKNPQQYKQTLQIYVATVHSQSNYTYLV